MRSVHCLLVALVALSLLACSGGGDTGPSPQMAGAGATGNTAASGQGGSTGMAGEAGSVAGTGGGAGAGDEPPEPPPRYPLDTSINPDVSLNIHLNHLGYEAHGVKRAVIEASAALASFQVVPEGADHALFQDALVPVAGFTAWGGGPFFATADFSPLEVEGGYTLYINGQHSERFEIGERLLFKRTVPPALDYLDQSRADHPEVWAADARVLFYGSAETRDVRGGWYDASGDISKYLSHLSYANFMNPQQIPLVTWALAWMRDRAADLLSAAGLHGQVQGEALYGADYLLRVLDDSGAFFQTIFDGWTGELEARRICAFQGQSGAMTADWQAAFREGGGMSIAALARISGWGLGGDFEASRYLSGAEAAFAHLQANSARYADDGVENIIDDYTALLAASELYAGTANEFYLRVARDRAAQLAERLHPDGYFVADGGSRPFWHTSDAGLPVVALARYLEVEIDTPSKEAAAAAIARHLRYLLSVSGEAPNPYGYARQHFESGGALRSGFFMPHDNESGYWWQGENARLASLAAAARIGGRALRDTAADPSSLPEGLPAFAADQLNWILGSNPFDVCFLNGFGRNNPFAYCDPANCRGKWGHHTLAGGISNGITGLHTDGTGIRWPASASEFGQWWWDSWRWVEQWLPHTAWYLLAVSAGALD